MIQGACQITFLGMGAVDAARLEVLAWLSRLAPLTTELTGGNVLIEAIDERRQQRRYHVRMELTMPDAVVVVPHDHPSNVAHEDLYVAIRNGFRAARRQLEDYFKTRGVSPVIEGDLANKISEVVAFDPRLENVDHSEGSPFS